MAEAGKYRAKSFGEMSQQAGRIHGEITSRMMGIVERYREEARRVASESGRRFDTSDRDRADYAAWQSPEYQRLQRRLNRTDAFLDRNRPNFEEETIDIFNPNTNTPEHRRNLAKLNRKTTRRR